MSRFCFFLTFRVLSLTLNTRQHFQGWGEECSLWVKVDPTDLLWIHFFNPPRKKKMPYYFQITTERDINNSDNVSKSHSKAMPFRMRCAANPVLRVRRDGWNKRQYNRKSVKRVFILVIRGQPHRQPHSRVVLRVRSGGGKRLSEGMVSQHQGSGTPVSLSMAPGRCRNPQHRTWRSVYCVLKE